MDTDNSAVGLEMGEWWDIGFKWWERGNICKTLNSRDKKNYKTYATN